MVPVVMAKNPTKPRTPPKAAKLNPDDWLNGGDDAAEETAARDDEADEESSRGTAGMLVNKSKLGMIFGLSQSYIDKALANGAPYVSRGTRKEGWRINTAAFHAWVKQEAVNAIKPEDPNRLTFDEAKAKKTQAEYERIEMENKRRRGELVTIDEVVTVYREEASIIRSQIMSIPDRAAIPLSAETDAAVIREYLIDEVNLALQNISGDNPEAWTDGNRKDSGDGDE